MNINISLNDEHATKIIESFQAVTNQRITLEGEFRPTSFILPEREENETDEQLITRVLKDITVKIVEIYENYKADQTYKAMVEQLSKPTAEVPEDIVL